QRQGNVCFGQTMLEGKRRRKERREDKVKDRHRLFRKGERKGITDRKWGGQGAKNIPSGK
ncbi:hypothetical protein, partial [Bacteroides sp.]|uniref:hypothetical protein n=1 Tax=Bacteroides sp. TaxID=29523 RepID=UPI002A80CB07